jgi:WD40 repeat protein
VIRVWDRKTLGLHRTLRGHEGPVNAIGLQSGRVVRTIGFDSKIRGTEGHAATFFLLLVRSVPAEMER